MLAYHYLLAGYGVEFLSRHASHQTSLCMRSRTLEKPVTAGQGRRGFFNIIAWFQSNLSGKVLTDHRSVTQLLHVDVCISPHAHVHTVTPVTYVPNHIC